MTRASEHSVSNACRKRCAELFAPGNVFCLDRATRDDGFEYFLHLERAFHDCQDSIVPGERVLPKERHQTGIKIRIDGMQVFRIGEERL
jgi:hypothetical protein